MADWKKRATLISSDVVYFEYVTSKLTKNSDLVYVWDIDKTYLDTHFESIKGLFRTAFEKAFQKKNVPGTGSLVRALTSSRARNASDEPFPIFFISASPPQLEPKIRTKLELDGIKPYGAFFKDNLRNLMPKRFWRLNKQVGYKLQALLDLRTRLGENVKQILWGDDSETDAVVYALYSDLCARRLIDDDVRYILANLYVTPSQCEHILEIVRTIPKTDPVEKIYINLAEDTDPEYYSKFGRRILATYNTFQTTLDLYCDGRLITEQVLRVAQDMVMNYGFTPEQLARATDDLISRGVITASSLENLIPHLQESLILPMKYRPIEIDPALSRFHQKMSEQAWIPETIDYLNDFR